MDGNKTKSKKMRKPLQIGNDVTSDILVTSSSRGIDKSWCVKEAANLCECHEKKKRKMHKRSVENNSPSDPPSNDFTPERNASAVTPDDSKSGLSSQATTQKRSKQETQDIAVESNKETEKTEGTKFSTCSLLEEDLFSQLPVNACLKEDSEVNYGGPGVCLSGDRSEAEKLCVKHDLVESIEICQDLEAMYSTPSSNTANICSAAESDGKPLSEVVNNIGINLVKTPDDHVGVANSSGRKIISDPPAVNSKSIPYTVSLLLVPNRMENTSLDQSVEMLPCVCSKHVNEKESDEAKVRIPSLLELCASRDEIAQNNSIEFLSQEGSLTGSSRKKLLVLDMNGLLADIVYNVLDDYTPDAIISRRAVFKRPFCDDFLQFCLARFNVGVWSSKTKKNVELILDFLLGNDKHKLLFCWDQSHCTDSGHTTVENRKKPLLVKKLKKLWEKYEPDLPWELEEYNESNTLLIDDSPYKAVCNPPYTAVFPPSYRYTNKDDNYLGPGGELRVFLEGLAMAENVQKYVVENPIGGRPITEKNASWNFYRKVIHECSSPENSPISDTQLSPGEHIDKRP